MRIQALVNISNTTFDSVQFLPKTLIYNISAFAHIEFAVSLFLYLISYLLIWPWAPSGWFVWFVDRACGEGSWKKGTAPLPDA